MKKTKIVATIGPASSSQEVLREMMKRGLNVARLNFSHGTHEEHKVVMDAVKQARESLDLPVAIMLDTKGPEIRTRNFKDGKAILKDDQEFTITTRDILGDDTIAGVTYEGLPEDVKVGDRILIDDGLIELVIKSIEGTEIHCVVENGGEVSNHKGVNVPMVNISLPAVTEKDTSDIVFGIMNGVDFIAASFVRKAQDVLDIRKVLEENGGKHIDIISKIENHEGVKNLDEIMAVSDGIMVARGDLGVEIAPEDVPLVQKEIIRKCNAVGKPVITATQMLDSMIRNPRPTRAEVTDVANSILDGTDAIMLSGETAVGKYPVEAVETMYNIALKIEDSINYQKMLRNKSLVLGKTITESVSFSACGGALNLNAKAILTPTSSGYTAKAVAKIRPKAPIIATTQSEVAARKLSLVWGVYPLLSPGADNTDELFENSINSAKEKGFLEDGDLIMITAGIPVGVAGTTNMIKVHIVGQITIKGTGIGTKSVRAKARVISTMKDLEEKFEEGDIIVAVSVDAPMMKYIEKAGGIVTEAGGLTSNAAIIGLNLDMPVIVGVENVKNKIKDGEMITLDPERGVLYLGEHKVL